MAVLIRAAKKRKEAADIYSANGRPELASAEERELEIIREYLPKPLSQDELEAMVRKVVSETGASAPGDFGKVMPLVMKEAKGRIDGKIVQSTVKKILEGPADGAH
ncbi:MAG TPA: GatB/YqeY domain-containing protein, partial [Bacteroidota bacterium]|nr:GatB/YqeY domain-containing protein [Bacteroidota bacterium]